MKNKLELFYRITFIIICGIGIFIHFDLNDRDYNAHEFSFFTLWSNIFCLVFMCVLLIKHFRGKDTLAKSLILDWILFQPKGLFRWRYAVTWLLFPLVYIISFFIRCKCNSQAEFINVPKYPYFFLNYEKIGTEKCMIYIFMLVVIFFGINLMMIFIDNFWERIKKNMV